MPRCSHGGCRRNTDAPGITGGLLVLRAPAPEARVRYASEEGRSREGEPFRPARRASHEHDRGPGTPEVVSGFYLYIGVFGSIQPRTISLQTAQAGSPPDGV